MTRHGKNCTAGAVYTYHEKKKDTGENFTKLKCFITLKTLKTCLLLQRLEMNVKYVQCSRTLSKRSISSSSCAVALLQ